MVAKGRGVFPIGEQNGKHKLTTAEVRQIQARRGRGERVVDIARDYPNVHESQISRVSRGVSRGAA
jgi:hypothetical protein